MKPKTEPDNQVRDSLAKRSAKSIGAGDEQAPKVDPQDENFEHTLRRAALAKEKKRSKNPGLYL